ncbi:MAG: DNA recombination protein RmuC [Clostridia bacterium]|nr:DNA recombination protein RmuC [Clostridia bacterium]
MTLEIMTYILLGLVVVLLIFVVIILSSNRGLNREINALVSSYQNLSKEQESQKESSRILTDSVRNMGELIASNQLSQAKIMSEQMSATKNEMNSQLDAMSLRLETMYKNLGEMENLNDGVTDLKKILSNVKTRGMLGETQLKAILEQILSKEQYDENVETVPGTGKRVEFAVKFPGDSEGPVYLPIDSKFPGETFHAYRDACEKGDTFMMEVTWKELEKTLKKEAKDIREKYIEIPYTTDFGIMFLPFEGLYAEAVNHNMVEILQRDFKVTIAGPTTMAVLLNSFQMGFRTLAIEKHSSEVWELLGAVKTEFEKYRGVLSDVRKALETADGKLEELSTTRTKAIERKLRSVESLEELESRSMLGLDELK